MPTYPEFLTTAQAAEFLNVSIPFLELCRRRGDGPPFHKLTDWPNGAIRYRKSALEAWLAEREQPPKRKRGRPKGSKNKTTAKKTGRRGWPSIASRNPIKVGG